MSRDVNAGLANSLVDEWARAGVVTAVLAPGSRSTPLALALAGDSRMNLDVFLDERSAAYFALGAAKASGLPVVVLTTSGTAAANLHPAVLEARYSRVPLIVCTADRPPELRDTGAGQSIDQLKLFGDTVRWFCEVGVPEDLPGAGRYWRSIAARAVTSAFGPPAGPVHLNLAFREPLVPTGEELAGIEGRPGGEPWVRSTTHESLPSAAEVLRVARLVRSTARGAVVAGWGAGVDPGAVERFAAAARWPVLADPLSGARQGPQAISAYDALLRVQPFAERNRPDAVVQLGAPLTSKAATTWLDQSVLRLLVDPDGSWLDPQRDASERLTCDPSALLEAVTGELAVGHAAEERTWLASWVAAEKSARLAIDGVLDKWAEPFEGQVARDLTECLPDGAALVVGSSMPVRDVEGFARPRAGVRFLANRGVNGIDGFVSTVLGVAAVSAGPVVALTGDLAFLHDAGGLLNAADRRIDAVFVVLDNCGGGIFNFLPQTRFGEVFERLFATPHNLDLPALASVHGIGAQTVGRADELVPAVESAVKTGGIQVVVVRTDRADNVSRHHQVWEAVAEAVRPTQH